MDSKDFEADDRTVLTSAYRQHRQPLTIGLTEKPHPTPFIVSRETTAGCGFRGLADDADVTDDRNRFFWRNQWKSRSTK
jgi:hypothetical protein